MAHRGGTARRARAWRAAACGGDDDDGAPRRAAARRRAPTTAASERRPRPAAAPSGATLTVGYSAWPGWFPLAVAEEQGIFEEAGVDVELTYFADYIASLDALVAGSIDVNTQTLNDTIFARRRRQPSSRSSSSTTTRPATTPSSATRRSRRSPTSPGKTIAAEPGVVDHFLLLQGLAEEGMTEDDIEFQGLPTDAAAAAFAGGQFDCVGVFAPFTAAGARAARARTCCSARRTSPAPSPTTSSPPPTPSTEHPEELQKLVDAWYVTLDWIAANPDEATAIMAEAGRASRRRSTPTFAEGTTIFDAEQALDAFADRAGDPTSLPEMARRINPFLVESGPDREGGRPRPTCSCPEFTAAYVESAGG